ncbi:MAG: tetratricopeptide repeat protein [Cellvibrionaceae bacterium]
MKYVKFPNRAFVLGLIGSAFAALSGCAFNADRDGWNIDGSVPATLTATEQFLPIQERDESGHLLPYIGAPNPYAELKGRVDKEAINTYIDARRAFNAQKYELADTLLAELVIQEPKLSGPWVMRGDVALAREELEQAVEYYAAALEVTPVNLNAYLRLAKTQRLRGHFRHAQNTYARALAIWPDGAEIHLNLGVLYDVYLNLPLRAQAHMEAYQLLSNGGNGQVLAWLEEIRSRTGVAKALPVIGPNDDSEAAIAEIPGFGITSSGESALAASEIRKE